MLSFCAESWVVGMMLITISGHVVWRVAASHADDGCNAMRMKEHAAARCVQGLAAMVGVALDQAHSTVKLFGNDNAYHRVR